MENKKLICLIDVSGLFYRAFFGIRANLTSPKGLPTNAIYGVARMIDALILELKPYAILATLDSKDKTFRHEIYPEYKANRNKMPDELIIQIPYIMQIIDLFNIDKLQIKNLEADDIIGNLTASIDQEIYDILIVSSDKDLAQLISDSVRLYDPMKKIYIDDDRVMEKFGTSAKKIPDIMALTGDSADNIPGVKGIGPKFAKELLANFDSVEDLLENTDRLTPQLLRRFKPILESSKEIALLSKKLALIDRSRIDLDPEKWKVKEKNIPELIKLYKELGFESLIEKIDQPKLTSLSDEQLGKKLIYPEDLNQLDSLIKKISKNDTIAIYIDTDQDTDTIKILRIGINEETLISSDLSSKIDPVKMIEIFKPILESNKIRKIGYDFKPIIKFLRRKKIDLAGELLDIKLISFLTETAGSNLSLDKIITKKLSVETKPEKISSFVYLFFELGKLLEKKMQEDDLLNLYKEIEEPLIDLLAKMEETGFLVDLKILNELSIELAEKLDQIEKEIFHMAGESFNINSPKQLGSILFEKLGLPTMKKGKSGYSTDHSVLEKLKISHPLPDLILNYRHLAKLKNTYVDLILELVDKKTLRVHTSFSQTTAVTGRLSSSSPNLQNIPKGDPYSTKIRSAFIAAKDSLIVSSDYSQIELRLLAHFSNDENLVKAFIENKDIHLDTAASIFMVSKDLVTDDMRQLAKSINFGLIYGQSAFGFSQSTNLSIQEAKMFIDQYFKLYPRVKIYFEQTKEFARENLFVTTLFKRRHYLPDIKSKLKYIREAAERNVLNSPMQGSAADITKLAMVNIDKIIKERNLKSKIILQLHDEIIFETKKDEFEIIKEIIKDKMSNVVKLRVPLLVNISFGKSLADTK